MCSKFVLAQVNFDDGFDMCMDLLFMLHPNCRRIYGYLQFIFLHQDGKVDGLWVADRDLDCRRDGKLNESGPVMYDPLV